MERILTSDKDKIAHYIKKAGKRPVLYKSPEIVPIRYGSELAFNIFNKPNWFLYSDGFIEDWVTSTDLSRASSNVFNFEHQKSVFKILPFNNFSTFKTQNELFLDYYQKGKLQKIETKFKTTGIKERSSKINGIQQKFLEEINLNLKIYEKSRGNPVLFGASTFLLMHKVSLKYLTLETDEGGRLKLVDFPDINSFFKFQSCLKIQTQQGNSVFSNDQVYLFSDRSVKISNPYLFVDHNSMIGKTFQTDVEFSIDNKSKLKVFLHQDVSEAENPKNIKVGDVIWLHFSERDYCYEFDTKNIFNIESLETQIHKETSNKKKENRNKKPDQKVRDVIKSLIQDSDIFLVDLAARRKKEGHLNRDLRAEGMFMIESEYPIQGEMVSFSSQKYRLKHTLTGKYLTLSYRQKPSLKSSLSQDQLFSFQSITSSGKLQEDFQGYLEKDSYFKLKRGNCWMRLPKSKVLQDDEYTGGKTINQKDSEEIDSLNYYDHCTQLDTFKVSKANFQEIWQANFLLSCFPIIIQGIMAYSSNRMEYTMANNQSSQKIQKNLLVCMERLQSFVTNSLPNSLSSTEEFDKPSPIRQQKLLEIHICELVGCLMGKLFPKIYSMPAKRLEILMNCHLHLSSTRSKQSYVELHASEQKQKFELYTDLDKVEVLNACLALLCKVSESNKDIQIVMTKFLDIFVNYLGITPLAFEAIRSLIKDNNQILMNFSKLKIEKKYDSSILGQGFQFFNSVLSKIHMFPKYSRNDLLDLVSFLCQSSDRSFFLNQNNIWESIRRKDIAEGHLIRLVLTPIKHSEFVEKIKVGIVKLSLNKAKAKNILDDYSEEELEQGSKIKNAPRNYNKTLEILYCKEDGMLDSLSLESLMKTQDPRIPKNLKKFLRSQLELYASLTRGRNTMNLKYHQNKFPISFLFRAIKSLALPNSLRATFMRMMNVFYIDKTPRREKKYPKFIRRLDTYKKQKKGENKDGDKVREDAYLVVQDDDDPPVYGFNIQETKEEVDVMQKFIHYVIGIVETKVELIGKTAIDEGNLKGEEYSQEKEIFSELTLEGLNSIELMLKFGFFGFQKEKNIPKIERIVKIASSLLEYDSNYKTSLQKEKISFTSQNKKLTNKVFNLPLLQRRKKQARFNENEVGLGADMKNLQLKNSPIFKKSEALHKILQKFLNKTFMPPPASHQAEISVAIKKVCCKLLRQVLTMREEIYISNFKTFFKESLVNIYKKNKAIIAKSSIKKNTDKDKKLASQLAPLLVGKFPELNVVCGDVPRSKGGASVLANLDTIIGRSFYEHLVQSIYFTNDYSLQNMQISLLNKYSMQRKTLVDNLRRNYLIFDKEQEEIFKKLKSNNIILQSFTNLTQVWLLIIKKSFYQIEYDDNINIAVFKLEDLLGYLQENSTSLLKIKQQVLLQLETHVILLQILREGLMVQDVLKQIMKEAKINFRTYRSDVFEKVCRLFTLCMQCLHFFALNNSRNQEVLYQHLDMVISFTCVNINQVELLKTVVTDNYQLNCMLGSNKLEFLFNMILEHGKVPKFLELIINLCSNSALPPVIKDKVVTLMLSEKYKSMIYEKDIDPGDNFLQSQRDYPQLSKLSFLPERNREEFEVKLVKILSRCSEDKMTINLIAKLFNNYSIKRVQERLSVILTQILNIVDEDKTPEKGKTEPGPLLEHAIDLLILLNTFAKRLDKKFRDGIQDNFSFYEKFLTKNLNIVQKLTASVYKASPFKAYIFGGMMRFMELSNIACNRYGFPSNSFDEWSKTFFSAVLKKIDIFLTIDDPLTYFEALSLREAVSRFRDNIPGILNKVEEDEGIIVSATREKWLFLKSEYVDTSSLSVGDQILQKPKLFSVFEEEGGDHSDFNEAWIFIKKRVLCQPEVEALEAEEQAVVSQSIINFSNCYSGKSSSSDLRITCSDIIEKLQGYLAFWVQNQGSKENIIFVLEIIGKVLVYPSQPDLRLRMQNMINDLGMSKILVSIFSSEKQNDIRFLGKVVSIMNLLLSEGNMNVQNTIFSMFNNSTISENFFQKVDILLNNEITILKEETLQGERAAQQQNFIMELLEMLRLFCENHHSQLQDYMRVQKFSANNYDVIGLVVRVLSNTKIQSTTNLFLEKIFDTLTEFCQGPCPGNQEQVTNSKFLAYATSLIKGDSRVFVQQNNYQILVGDLVKRDKSSKKEFSKKKENEDIQNWKIERLRYKCLITVMSLIEKRGNKDRIFDQIVTVMSTRVLKKRLVSIYQLFIRDYKGIYSQKNFGWIDQQKNDSTDKERKDECIIENGFNIFILMKTLIDKAGSREEELRGLDMELNNLDKQKNLIGKVFSSVTNASKNMMSITLMTNDEVDKDQNAVEDGTQQEIEKIKAETSQALAFFNENTAEIDIVRDGVLEKVYFQLMPFCRNLSEKQKKRFQNEVDRSSTKVKLASLMKASDLMINVMRYEYWLISVFKQYPLLEGIANNQSFLENLVFVISIIYNMMLLFYYQTSHDQKKFEDPVEYFEFSLGMIILMLGTIIFLLESAKRVPILCRPAWNSLKTWLDQHQYENGFLIIFKYSEMILYCLVACLSDAEYLFTIYYVFFAFMGILVSYTFFVSHLADILRIGILKNVISALWIRRTPLALTFLLFLLLEYFFTLISFLAFHEQYPNKRCSRLWECFFENFDLTFKEGGGVGSFLGEIWEQEGSNMYARFFYDNILGLLQIQIMLNLFQGIIIDEFGALKEKVNEKEEDQSQLCFICGLDRSLLEKEVNGFNYHYQKVHNMWNYVFYKAYLKVKPETEFTGTESYVYDKIESQDLDWFPIRKCFGVKDEIEETMERLEELNQIAIKRFTPQFEKQQSKIKSLFSELENIEPKMFQNNFNFSALPRTLSKQSLKQYLILLIV